MLKPENIKNVEFELSVLGGYKREQVDEFIDSIVSDYERLFTENSELIQKLKVCVSKIEEYQKEEHYLKSAILNAEKLNENALKEIEEHEKRIVTEAKEKADSIIQTARVEAEDIVKSAREQAADAIEACEAETAKKIALLNEGVVAEQEKLDAMKKEVADFKESVLRLYKKHLDSLSKLPEYTPAKVEKTAVESTATVTVDLNDDIAENEGTVSSSADSIVENVATVVDEIKKEDDVDDNTAEFVIDKKKTTTGNDESEAPFDRNFKFSKLKFGADFDVKKDD